MSGAQAVELCWPVRMGAAVDQRQFGLPGLVWAHGTERADGRDLLHSAASDLCTPYLGHGKSNGRGGVMVEMAPGGESELMTLRVGAIRRCVRCGQPEQWDAFEGWLPVETPHPDCLAAAGSFVGSGPDADQ